jgi:ATP-dependent DNA helicase RecQ
MTVSESALDLSAALAKFGLQTFRRGQKEVIEHIISGKDCLCVMPTGGGKSLCYQLPSLVRPGMTIVVSPLIALMKDQVDGLERRGISATLINSSLSHQEQSERLDQVASGKFSMVYVAPERLRNPRFLDAIRATPVQLLAIDEAHCISEWGHDFRPDYHRLGKFREALGNVQTIALTATATPRVRTDILDSLQLQTARTFITGFARDNLYFGSAFCMSDRDKDKHLSDFLTGRDESGIIYVATRKRCEALVEQLGKELKLSVGAYHAGLLPEQRKLVQEKFMAGELKAIVATNAFGMGIDKSDLRYVIHYNMPGTLEAYYQEAGRAGRDGLLSQCVLLFSPQDRYIQEFFIENANPSKELLRGVYNFLASCPEDPIELTAEEIKEQIPQSATSEAVNSALQILSRTGVLERLEVASGLAMFRLSNRMNTFVDLLPRDATQRRHVLRTVEKAIGDRRDEAVYIHPRWLSEQLGMDREQMVRHLRELCKLEDFEYVPPFRGRAIHFRRKDVHFDDLKIDHATLDVRRKADYEKLDQMVGYARTKACRQKTILLYFGDTTASDCKICDRCQGRSGWPKLPKQPARAPSQKLPAHSLPSPEIGGSSLVGSVLVGSGIPALETPTNPPSPPNQASQASDKQPANTANTDDSEPLENLAIPILAPNPKPKSAKPKAESPKPASSTPNKPPAKKPAAAPTQEIIRKSIQSLQMLLAAIARTHGYLSKTVLAQHFAGTASKAVVGLRLERLAEFGMLKSWKKAHASQLIESLIEHQLVTPLELKLGKQTIAITELGKACIQTADSIPGPVLDFTAAAWTASTEPDAEFDAAPLTGKQRDAVWTEKPAPESTPASAPESTPASTEKIDTVRSADALPPEESSDASLHATNQSILSDWQWTLRLVRHGYRLGECALIRGKTPDGILADLTIALQMDQIVPLEHLFDTRTLLTIQELARQDRLPDRPPTMLLVFSGLWDFVQEWLTIERKNH